MWDIDQSENPRVQAVSRNNAKLLFSTTLSAFSSARCVHMGGTTGD